MRRREDTDIYGGRATRPAAGSRKFLFHEDVSGLKAISGQYAVVVLSLDLIVVNRGDGDMTKSTVQKRQIAHLVQMVMEAAPAN
jgi:hypothetical protein